MRIGSWNGRIRIHAIIDVLRKLGADVICLQEVASNHPELEGDASANQFRQLAAAFGGHHPSPARPTTRNCWRRTTARCGWSAIRPRRSATTR